VRSGGHSRFLALQDMRLRPTTIDGLCLPHGKRITDTAKRHWLELRGGIESSIFSALRHSIIQSLANDSTRNTSNRVRLLLYFPPVNAGVFLYRIDPPSTRPVPETEYRAHASVIRIDILSDRTYYGRGSFGWQETEETEETSVERPNYS